MQHRYLLVIFAGVLLSLGCAKEEPVLTATLHAKCRDCVVSYAAGAAQSKKDTLLGVVDPASGDTVAEEHQWSLQLKDGDHIYLRACRLRTDTAFGDIQVWVDGGVQSLQAQVDTTQECAEINQSAHGL
ncbi:MAG: hypothetical protein WBB32_03630 [Flavobacteriales bacterium]